MRKPARKSGASAQPAASTDTSDSSSVAERVILDGLLDVLREATARGIGLAASFRHFDRRHEGLVGAEEFMAAVVELRIGSAALLWDERDAESCIERISKGKSRAYFSQSDFVAFFSARIGSGQRSGSAVSETRNENKCSQQQQSGIDSGANKKPLTIAKPAKKHKRTKQSGDSNQSAKEGGTSPIRDYLDEYHAQRLVFQSLNDASVGMAMTGQQRKKRPLVTLPTWAHDRSKRALQELESLQQRKKRLPPSLSSRLFYDGGVDQDDVRPEESSPSDATIGITKLQLPIKEDNANEMLEFPVDTKWQSFELDADTQLSYAILSHETVVSTTSSSADSPPNNNNKNNNNKQRLSSTKYQRDTEVSSDDDDDENPKHTNTAFRFTIFLDAFQRLETLEVFFKPLLLRFPRGKILLCGFPTKTPRKKIWNSDCLAQAYGKLLVHLMHTTREWLVQPKLGVGAVPQFLIGFGTGGGVALRLLTMEIPLRMVNQPQLQLFLRAQRGLVLVNALTHTSDSVRHSLQQLKRVFGANGNPDNRVELHESLAQSLFSEFYLTQVAASRQDAMQTFFKTRRQFLQGANLELLRILLHGGLKSKDVGQSLPNLSALQTPFALVMVHGTLNSLFPVDQVEFVIRAFPSECMAPSLAASLSSHSSEEVGGDIPTPQVHVSWLKSGHDVLQERSNFMHELFRQLVLVDVADVLSSVATVTELAPLQSHSQAQAMPQAQDIAVESAVKTEALKKTLSAVSLSASGTSTTYHQVPVSGTSPVITDFAMQVSGLLAQNGIKWIQQELYDRGLEGSGSSDAILTRYQQVLHDEFAQACAKETQDALQKARFEVFEAKRRERQREELDQQLREKEAQLRIKRREHEVQKAFFAQMEAQKDAQTRMALEHELMALEDVLSQKHEEFTRLEDERLVRNSDMTKQVEEIEAERLENEREAFQVHLQQERLVAQHEKREKLKKFQKDFETNELVSSPVEAYTLDLTPKYENFSALADGASELTKDLVHFYELKASQKDESAEKRLEFDAFKGTLADKGLALRNLERVILKAKSTGMIAKAGLGTVRIVPITTQEFQALNRELDEKQDEMARLQLDAALRSEELSWKDKLLQRLSELIKRNEGFRDETLRKLALCAEKGNEMVLSAREEGEKLFEQREANTKLEKRFVIRLQGVKDERNRAGESASEYFDTRLRIEGTTQRVLRLQLLKELDAEISDLEKKLEGTQALEVEIRAKLKVNNRTLAEFGAQTFKVEQILAGLEQAIFMKDSRRDSVSRTAGGDDLGGRSDTNGLAVVRPDLAEHVRMKPHAERTLEEKQWVAMDFLVNFAHYYKFIAAEQVEIIQKSPEYQACLLKKDAIARLLQLPARNCLALAFFRAKEELEAHYLLRKYTFGDGEGYFASLDDAFALDSEQNSTCIVTTKLEELADAVDTASLKGKAAGHFIPRGCYALLDENAKPTSLLSASGCQIHPHKSATHTFKLPTLGVGVLSLSVSVVFQGHFKSVGYQNGRLAGMLYVLPPPSGQSINQPRAPLPIGKCFYQQDIALCTPQSLGKLVIRHDPKRKPLSAAATYQVVLGAPVFTSYSIEVTATTALSASEALKLKRSDALKKQELLPLKKDEIQSVFVTIQLSERKKRLAHKMANETKDVARATELEMIKSTKALEEDNIVSTLSHEQRSQLHTDVHLHETKFTNSCFLFAKREEEARDIESGLKELTKIHADLLEQCDTMERDLVEYRANLPQLAASLVDSKDPRDRDAAGAKLARELNVEYESAGMKSGKVLWAEISAMKAKLPSMMTPAERLRRKYKKGLDVLEKKEREWILIDRILHPRSYDWEERLVVAASGGSSNAGNFRMRLHGAFPKLTKDEEQLAVLSRVEVDRIMKAPWNLLERKEIQIRKIVTKFRDDNGSNGSSKKRENVPPTSMVALLRSQKTTELTTEEREWRLYDQLLNPSYYPVSMKKLADEIRSLVTSSSGGARGGAQAQLEVKIPANLTREDLVAALNTPEEELFKLVSDHLRARTLLLKYDPQLSVNLLEAARIQHGQSAPVEIVETDIDARCRLVYQELQRAIANTRNEFMDSHVLHSTLQRFPTKVLRLELEKELDQLLISQVVEREEFELRTFLVGGGATKKALELAHKNHQLSGVREESESDSDEEAQIAREAKAQSQAKLDAKAGKNTKVRGKALKQKSIQKQRREIKDVRAFICGSWSSCQSICNLTTALSALPSHL